MNIAKLNTAYDGGLMNIAKLNTAYDGGLILNTGSGGGNSGGGGDAPSGYSRFLTADGMVFTASDGVFYVKL